MPKNVEIAVKIGDRVIGGETVIARYVEYNVPQDYSKITASAELPAAN